MNVTGTRRLNSSRMFHRRKNISIRLSFGLFTLSFEYWQSQLQTSTDRRNLGIEKILRENRRGRWSCSRRKRKDTGGGPACPATPPSALALATQLAHRQRARTHDGGGEGVATRRGRTSAGEKGPRPRNSSCYANIYSRYASSRYRAPGRRRPCVRRTASRHTALTHCSAPIPAVSASLFSPRDHATAPVKRDTRPPCCHGDVDAAWQRDGQLAVAPISNARRADDMPVARYFVIRSYFKTVFRC